jgi:hypothetical protein
MNVRVLPLANPTSVSTGSSNSTKSAASVTRR